MLHRRATNTTFGIVCFQEEIEALLEAGQPPHYHIPMKYYIKNKGKFTKHHCKIHPGLEVMEA